MFRITVLLAIASAALAAENPRVFFDKPVKIDPSIGGMETKEVSKKQNQPEPDHPVFRAEEKSDGWSRIEPVKPRMTFVKHDMLADEPMQTMQTMPTEVDKIDQNNIPNYGYSNPAEVTYPDLLYAPGYGFAPAYTGPTSYDMYGSTPSDFLADPDTSPFGLLWNQIPNSRTIVNYAGRTIGWILNSIFVIIFGSLLTIGICTYTNLCKITFDSLGPIHEEMRSLMSPEKLDKISNAADFVKSAIDKYQQIQKVTDITTINRKRRASLI